MAKKIIKAQMKQRRDTLANWAAANPVLLDGELGFIEGVTDRFKVGDGKTAWNDLPFFSGGLDPSGRYPDLSVGFADDLVGRGESVPAEFSFRASGGKSIKDGTAWIKRLKGNSVVWNQKLQWRGNSNVYKGLTVTYEGGKVHIQGAPEDTEILFYSLFFDDAGNSQRFTKNHYYLIRGASEHFELIVYSNVSVVGSNVITQKTGDACRLYLRGHDLTIGQEVNESFSAQYIDLTQMFQAGNEPTTIEEFYARKPIVADEYAYNEGEVIHMTAEGIKSVGDNAWDEEWIAGRLNTNTGQPNIGNNGITSKNYIRVLPNETYYCGYNAAPIFAMFYDAEYNLIRQVSGSNHFINIRNRQFTTPANAVYMRFYVVDMTTYNNDIMITLVHSGWKQDTDAGYQPYWQDILPLPIISKYFPDGMKKWDKVYNKDGKGYIVKGTGVKKLWELNGWIRGSALVFIATIPDMMPSLNINNGIMAEYNLCSSQNGNTMMNNAEDKSYITNGGAVGGAGRLAISDSAYNDVDSFVAHLESVQAKLYYELAEPTIIEYDEPFNLDYKVADFGTEQAIAEQPSAPISADIIYQFNAVDMIREHEIEINELQSIIATMQAQLASLTSNNG